MPQPLEAVFWCDLGIVCKASTPILFRKHEICGFLLVLIYIVDMSKYGHHNSVSISQDKRKKDITRIEHGSDDLMKFAIQSFRLFNLDASSVSNFKCTKVISNKQALKFDNIY